MYMCIVYQIIHFLSARETKEKLDGIYTLLTTVTSCILASRASCDNCVYFLSFSPWVQTLDPITWDLRLTVVDRNPLSSMGHRRDTFFFENSEEKIAGVCSFFCLSLRVVACCASREQCVLTRTLYILFALLNRVLILMGIKVTYSGQL